MVTSLQRGARREREVTARVPRIFLRMTLSDIKQLYSVSSPEQRNSPDLMGTFAGPCPFQHEHMETSQSCMDGTCVHLTAGKGGPERVSSSPEVTQ